MKPGYQPPTRRPCEHATAPRPAVPPRPFAHSAKLVAAGRPDARGMGGRMREDLGPGITL